MRINGNEKYHGYSFFQIRKLLRIGKNNLISPERVISSLKIELKEAKKLLQRLECDGYIEPNELFANELLYSNTLKGSSFALASAAKPLNRETAERKIDDLLARVNHVNSTDYYLYYVKRVLLFGSMLTDVEHVSDVDVFIELIPKLPTKKLHAINDKRVNLEIRKGKRFSNYTDQLFWTRDQVFIFLKSRSRGLSIHEMEDEIINQVNYKALFELNI